MKDTTEVDYNVSRHLEVELVADNWDLMVCCSLLKVKNCLEYILAGQANNLLFSHCF